MEPLGSSTTSRQGPCKASFVAWDLGSRVELRGLGFRGLGVLGFGFRVCNIGALTIVIGFWVPLYVL